MKRIHRKTLGIYSHLWGYHLNTFSGTRLVGSRLGLTSITPSVDTSNKFRSFYSPSSNLFSSQILPSSSSTERVPSTSTGTTEAAESPTSTATSGANNNLTSIENMVAENASPEAPKISNIFKKDSYDRSQVDYVGTQLFIAKDCAALLAVYNNERGVRLNIRHVCQAICSLGERVKNSPSPEEAESLTNLIVNDDRFKKMCLDLQAAQFEEIPHLLLIAIQGLSNLGLLESMVMKTLENEVKWVVRRCPIKVVAKAVGTLTTTGAGSGGDNSVIKTSTTKLDSTHPLVVCVYALQRRWVEVTAGSDFIAVFQVISYLSDETKSKLEDRAVELVQGFTAMEMVKIFIGLGCNKRRPTPLLRALAFHLAKNPENIPPKDIIELIYALNVLSFCDPLLMERLCSDLIPGISSVINSALISSLVTSLGQLRYKNTELLGAIEDWILKHLDELRPFDLAAWILACSVLNLNSNPENLTSVCNKAKELLEPTKLDNPIRWVNIVHALTILNQVDSSILSTALEPNFVAQLDALGDKKNLIGVNCKLLNLNAVSKTLKDYKGHCLSNEIVAKWTPGVQVRSDANLSKSAFEALSNFLPPPKYLLGSQPLPSGVFVDAVCKLNSKLDPIPLDSQEGVTVAVVVQGYPSMTLGLKELTGASCLNVRILQNEGYTVVTVPYNEFNTQEKLLRKVQYLEQRMRNIQLPQKSASSSSESQSISSSSKENINKTQPSER